MLLLSQFLFQGLTPQIRTDKIINLFPFQKKTKQIRIKFKKKEKISNYSKFSLHKLIFYMILLLNQFNFIVIQKSNIIIKKKTILYKKLIKLFILTKLRVT